MTSFSVSKLKIHIIRVGLRMWIFELYDREWRHSQVQTVLSFYIQLTKPYKIQLFSITSEILGPSISTVPTLNIHFWNFSLWLQHYDCSFIKRIFDHFDWIFPSKPVWTIPRNNFGNCDFVHIWFSFFSWFRIWFPIFPRFSWIWEVFDPKNMFLNWNGSTHDQKWPIENKWHSFSVILIS